ACHGRILTVEEVMRKKLFTPTKAREELPNVLLMRSAEFISDGNVERKNAIRVNFIHMTRDNEPDQERQRLVLQALTHLMSVQAKKPDSLIIAHCAVLDSKLLEPFLHENLEYLDLRFCNQIKDDDIELISRKCRRLKELSLHGCLQLKLVAQNSIVF